MDKTPQISVIVPVYNAERWLRKCLDSLLAQTFVDFELILIDDGSPDGCGGICDRYAAMDNRVMVIHQPNGGVSKARQTGIEVARGEYVIHCDPDDWVEPEMLAGLYAEAKAGDADMVICDYSIDDRTGIHVQSQDPGELTPANLLRKFLSHQLNGSCCNKLVRRACYGFPYEIRFTPGHLTYGEDLLFNCRLAHASIKSVAYLPKAFYHYCIQNEGSLTHKKDNKRIDSVITIVDEIKRFLNIEEYDHLQSLTVEIMPFLFENRRFGELKNLYPEARARIIKQYPYSCLALALRGYPRLAYALSRLKTRYDK